MTSPPHQNAWSGPPCIQTQPPHRQDSQTVENPKIYYSMESQPRNPGGSEYGLARSLRHLTSWLVPIGFVVCADGLRWLGGGACAYFDVVSYFWAREVSEW